MTGGQGSLANLPSLDKMGSRKSIQGLKDTMLSEEVGNDDELEKLERQKRRCADKVSNSSKPSLSRKQMAPDELSSLYNKCIKFVSENKVNNKNAFDLPLIEYLKDLAEREGTVENIQVAAGSLSASATIYSYRVDSVHHDTIKMAGSITQGPSRSKGSEDNENVDEDSEQSKKQKKRNRKKGSTLEKNLANITLENINPDGLDRSSFQRLVSNFGDKQCGSNYFMNLLDVEDDSLCFVLDNCMSGTSKDLLEDDLITTAELKAICEKPTFEESEICPAFTNFKFKQSEEDSEINRDESIDNSHTYEAGDIIYHGGDGGNDTLNYSIQNPVEDLIEFRRGKCAAGDMGVFSNIENCSPNDLISILSNNPNEYSFFDEKLISSNSLFKKRSGMPRVSCDLTKRKPKALTPLSFDMNEKSLKLACKLGSSNKTTLPASTVKKWSSKATQLYISDEDNFKNISRLFTLPSAGIKKSKTSITLDEDALKAYDYNNLNDSQNFCPGADPADDDEDDVKGEFDLGPFDEELLSCPQQLEKISIRYETTAKIMDMRKLKEAIWATLTKDTGELTGSMDFDEMYNTLPSKLTSSMHDSLTIPLVAVALLHLANEKVLNITNDNLDREHLNILSEAGSIRIMQG